MAAACPRGCAIASASAGGRASARASRTAFFSGARVARRAPAVARRARARAPATPRADVRKSWRSSKSMTLTIADEDEPPADFSAYISDGERIVNVTFPDESRRTKLDDTTWQVQLLPFQFMQYRATVVTTLTLEPVGGELRLSSTDLRIQGLPDEFGVNGKVWLAMDGALKPARTRTSGGRKVLGKLTVNLTADVNEMVALVPGLDDAVNLINDTVIANLQGSINDTIAGDYAKWRAGEAARVEAGSQSVNA